MKMTKTMIYKPTVEARELELFVNNNYDCYCTLLDVEVNLQRHYDRGNFSIEKAIIVMYHVADYASKAYFVDFGYKFGVVERFTVACELLTNWIGDNPHVKTFKPDDVREWLETNGRVS